MKLKLNIPSIKYYPVKAPVAVDDTPDANKPKDHKTPLYYFKNYVRYSPAFSKVISMPSNFLFANTQTNEKFIKNDTIKIMIVSTLKIVTNYFPVKSRCFLVYTRDECKKTF